MTLRIYGDLALQNQSALRLLDASNGFAVQLKAPASLSQDTTFQLPSSLGQNNQVLITDASGQFSFSFLADANVAANAAISLSKLAALTVSKALVSDGNGVISASNVTATEMGYLSGVTGSVQGQLDSEAAARQAADSQEASDRAAAVSAEASAREAADSAEAAARQAADTQEAASRAAADQMLQSNIDAEASARAAAVSSEASARQTADAEEAAARQAADLQEASDRAAADLVLDGKIATEKGRIDAILLASEADKDSFAEIVQLINSVDTENDNAFASYVLSNNAALAQEVSDRQAADSSEASARQAADASEASARQAADQTLQSNLDAEVSARQSAISSEASARSSADTALGARIDALTTESLTDVSEASKANGDLFQYDSATGKWKNVAPISEAAVGTSSSGPAYDTAVLADSPEAYLRLDETSGSSFADSSTSGSRPGSVYGSVTPGNVGPLASGGHSVQFNGSSFLYTSTPVSSGRTAFSIEAWIKTSGTGTILAGTSSPNELQNYGGYTPVLYVNNTGRVQFFNFNVNGVGSDTISANPVNDGQWHHIVATGSAGGAKLYVDGVLAAVNGTSAVPWVYTNYWRIGHNKDMGNFFTGFMAEVATYTTELTSTQVAAHFAAASGSGGGTSSPTVGVIKTNTAGQLDDSFLAHDVDFGGHKLKGVLTPTADTEGANKKYVDDQVSSEASLRSSAIASEASSRAAADSSLQNSLNQEISDRQNAVSSEASTRYAADLAEQSAREAADLAEQTAREAAVQDLQGQINSLGSGSSSALSQEILDRQAADASEASARQAADTELDSKIATEKGRIDAILLASTADKDSFKEIVDLINSVDAENDSAFAGYVLSNNAALAQEVSDRQAADSSEASARSAADTMLQGHIDDEAAARAAADSAEMTAREAADSVLQSNIDSEASARAAAVLAEQSARESADQDIYTYIDGHKYKTDWVTGDGSSKTVTHNMGTKDVVVQVYDKSDGSTLMMEMIRATNNTVTMTSTEAPGSSGWRVLVLKV